MSVVIRPAAPGDAPAIAGIHNEGVAERIATFRADPRPVADVEAAIERGGPLLVGERGGEVVGWASVGPYDDPSEWYAGVGEATIYVAAAARRTGAGRELLGALEDAAAKTGRHKLIAKIFDTNEPSLALFGAAGYQRVGVHRRHGRLDGEWRDVVVLEKLIGVGAGASALRDA